MKTRRSKFVIGVGLAALIAVGVGVWFSAFASPDPLDQRFPDDFFASRPMVAPIVGSLPDSEKLLLVGFLNRVRMCQLQDGIWIHRGITFRQAIELERELAKMDEGKDVRVSKIACAVR